MEEISWKLKMCENPHATRSRVYVFVHNESVMENLMKRHSRPYDEYRNLLLKKLILPPSVKLKWSQKCGCACGCSPGFIVEGHRFTTPAGLTADLYADIKP